MSSIITMNIYKVKQKRRKLKKHGFFFVVSFETPLVQIYI